METKHAIVVIIIVAAIVGGIAYYFGDKFGYAAGHDKGYANAQKDYNANPPKTYYFEYQQALESNSKLVNDYNSLLNTAQQYVNTSRYQPISCTSSTLSVYTYTNCY